MGAGYETGEIGECASELALQAKIFDVFERVESFLSGDILTILIGE